MPHLSNDPTEPPSPTVAVRRAVHTLHGVHAESERWGNGRPAWAARPARPPTPAGEPLGEWLGVATTSDPLVAALAGLRAAATHLACGLRAEGARPEQMLVRVKACVHDAITGERWDDPDTTRALTAEVVRWSIDAYYGAPADA